MKEVERMTPEKLVEKVLSMKEVSTKKDMFVIQASIDRLYKTHKFLTKEQYDTCIHHITHNVSYTTF